jgi:hypothetical protein
MSEVFSQGEQNPTGPLAAELESHGVGGISAWAAAASSWSTSPRLMLSSPATQPEAHWQWLGQVNMMIIRVDASTSSLSLVCHS